MEKIVFKCLKCGRCCRTLLKDVNGILRGLGLTIEETRLFPTELISPGMGIGYGEIDKPKFVLQYQLNVNECPHLSENNLCKIYQERPLACSAFPLISMGPHGTVIAKPTDCRFVEEYELKYSPLNTFLSPQEFIAPVEWSARFETDEQLKKMFQQHIKDVTPLWDFDLGTKEWIITRIQLF